MTTSLQSLFERPAYWAFFDDVLKALDQQDDLRIDPALFMERIALRFIPHAEAMTPRRIVKPLDGYKYDRHVSHYVFCTGRGKDSPYGYRVFSIEHAYTNAKLQHIPQHISVMDARRPLDNSELLGKTPSNKGLLESFKARKDMQGADRFQKFLPAACAWLADDNLVDARFETGFEKFSRPDRFYKRLKSSAQWMQALDFLDDAGRVFAPVYATNRSFVVNDMLCMVDDLIGYSFDDIRDNIKANLRPLLADALARFDEEMTLSIQGMANDAKAQLDGEALNLLRQNPSAFTVRNYTLLTGVKTSESEIQARIQGARGTGSFYLSQEAMGWRHLARTAPIALLMGDRGLSSQLMRQWAFTGYADDFIFPILFGTKDPARIATYKALRETHISPASLRRLRATAHALEQHTPPLPIPNTPQGWTNFENMHDTAHEIAPIINRSATTVLHEIITESTGTLTPYFNRQSANGAQAVHDLQILKNRIVASALAPKIHVETGGRIPVSHIFYMLAKYTLVDKNRINASIPQRTRRVMDDFNAGNAYLHMLFYNVPTVEILNRAYDFSIHRHDWDAKLRELIYTNRLYEHGALYNFAPIPFISMKEEGYSFMPLRNQADLFKECDETGGDMWRLGKRALHEGLHFVSIRKQGGQVFATACISEPEHFNGPWSLHSIETPEGQRGNRHAADVLAMYLEHPQFRHFVHTIHYDSARKKLRDTLKAQAKDTELMGFKVGNADERRAMLQALAPYIETREAWEIDHNGCLSSPRINEFTSILAERLLPHYGTPKPA